MELKISTIIVAELLVYGAILLFSSIMKHK